MPNLNQMNESARVLLEEITGKEVIDLTANEISFLKARRDYLTKEQSEYYADALNGRFTGKDAGKPEEIEVKFEEKKVFDKDDYTHEVLLQMVKDAGLDADPKLTKQQLVDLLNAR